MGSKVGHEKSNNWLFHLLKRQRQRLSGAVAKRFHTILCAHWVSHALHVALIFSVSLLLVQLALGISGLTRTEKFVGPFAAETEGSKALIIHLNRDSMLRHTLGTGGDSSRNAYASTLIITINGVALGPAHTLHDRIRNDDAARGAYSHWRNSVIFSLPEGVHNSSGIQLDATYPLLLRNVLVGGSVSLLVLAMLLLGLRRRILDPEKFEALATRWHDLFFASSRAVWVLCFAAAAAYLATVGYGLFDGWYLANTAVFSYFPWVQHLARVEPDIPYMILGYAFLGAVLSWMASSSERAAHDFSQREQRLVGVFNRFGLVFLLGLFLFSVAGTWAGIPRIQDLSGNAVGGLVPFNDATGHFSQTFVQAIHGQWEDFASRRPLAAALRSAGMFLVGYSNAGFLVCQTMLMALATFIATRSIISWRGLWAGLTFLGLSVIGVRPYLPTNLTEPLGFLLALASIPYFVHAVTGGSLAAKGVGLLLTVWALTVRMGNMFFIPALGLWVFLSSGNTRHAKRRAVAVVLAAVVFALGFNSWLSRLYGSEDGALAGNFSYVFCGLTHNGDWTRCGTLYATEVNALGTSEADKATFFYRRGFEKLVSEPLLILQRLAWNTESFMANVPAILLKGYTSQVPLVFPKWLWLLAAIYGVYWRMTRDMHKDERIFWAFFCLSLVGSASIVFADDGLRVLCVSYPLLSMLVASGFSGRTWRPRAESNRDGRAKVMNRISVALVGAIGVGSVALPWAAYKLDVVKGRSLMTVPSGPEETVFLSSRYMTGFLVLPDGTQLKKEVPSMHLSAFTQIIKNSGIEQYEPLVTPAPPRPPFGVVAAPRATVDGGTLMIVPEHVLLNRAALGWRIRFSGGSTWRRVETAVPIYEPGTEP